MERHTNCISFIYYHFGIKSYEEYRQPPQISEIYKYFYQVGDVQNADVIAAGFTTNESIIIFHTAVLSEDKKSVTHREGYDKPVTPQNLEKFLQKYNSTNFGEVFRLIFLKKR